VGGERSHGELARLRAYGIRPTRARGQHFLFNPRLLAYLADQASVGAADRVIEVGPGTGALTRILLARGARVTAVEIDRGLCRLLRDELGGAEGFRLIEGDVLAGKHRLHAELLAEIGHAPPRSLKVVANLPFSAATPFLIELLAEAPDLETAVVTIQKEVADRFAARPNEPAYGVISVLAQVLAGVEKLKRIRKQSFWPPPTVDACVVRFTPHRLDRPSETLFRALRELVAWAFQHRRKKLLARLESRWPGLPAGAIIGEDARPDAVGPDAYLALARAGEAWQGAF
jgi:16S rRNA (adenine1518-N6/adenine1519-N6)-dimethyltransferase